MDCYNLGPKILIVFKVKLSFSFKDPVTRPRVLWITIRQCKTTLQKHEHHTPNTRNPSELQKLDGIRPTPDSISCYTTHHRIIKPTCQRIRTTASIIYPLPRHNLHQIKISSTSWSFPWKMCQINLL